METQSKRCCDTSKIFYLNTLRYAHTKTVNYIHCGWKMNTMPYASIITYPMFHPNITNIYNSELFHKRSNSVSAPSKLEFVIWKIALWTVFVVSCLLLCLGCKLFFILTELSYTRNTKLRNLTLLFKSTQRVFLSREEWLKQLCLFKRWLARDVVIFIKDHIHGLLSSQKKNICVYYPFIGSPP